MKIIDAEVHLLPPEWCAPDYLPEKAESIIRPAMYEHPQSHAALKGAHEYGLLAEMEKAGVDEAVLMGLPWKSRERCEINNQYVAAVCTRYPDRFVGAGILPPLETEDPLEAVKRLHIGYGFKAIKVIPSWHGYRLDDLRLEPALQYMEQARLALVTHTDLPYRDPAVSDTAHSLLTVATRHPALRISAPHLGGLLCLFALHPPLSQKLSNILFLGSVSATLEMISFAQQSVGYASVAFASDFPFNWDNSMLSVVEGCRRLSMSEEEQRLFYYDNWKRFWAELE